MEKRLSGGMVTQHQKGLKIVANIIYKDLLFFKIYKNFNLLYFYQDQILITSKNINIFFIISFVTFKEKAHCSKKHTNWYYKK